MCVSMTRAPDFCFFGRDALLAARLPNDIQLVGRKECSVQFLVARHALNLRREALLAARLPNASNPILHSTNPIKHFPIHNLLFQCHIYYITFQIVRSR